MVAFLVESHSKLVKQVSNWKKKSSNLRSSERENQENFKIKRVWVQPGEFQWKKVFND